MRILGVDPGSRFTGYGCVDRVGNQIRLVTHGTLKLLSTGNASFEDRLLLIHEGLSSIIKEFKPAVMVVEKIFFAKNAVSALKLGQARGAVILTGKIHSLLFAEYSPTEVKRAIAGNGQADKGQVARVLNLLLGAQEYDTPDASDGLALALCHAQLGFHQQMSHAGQALALQSQLNRRSNKRKLTLAESLGFQSPQGVNHSMNKRNEKTQK